jgi:hypothetical protein
MAEFSEILLCFVLPCAYSYGLAHDSMRAPSLWEFYFAMQEPELYGQILRAALGDSQAARLLHPTIAVSPVYDNPPAGTNDGVLLAGRRTRQRERDRVRTAAGLPSPEAVGGGLRRCLGQRAEVCSWSRE